MKLGSVFWGIVLLAVGGLLLTNNLFPGLFRGVDVWDLIWPLMLVGIGVWFLVGPAFARRNLDTLPVSVDLQGASEAAIDLQHGAGRLDLRSGAAAGLLLSGSCVGGARVESHLSGSRLDVRLRSAAEMVWMGFPAVSGRGYEWNLVLAQGVPLRLALETGASESVLDLSDLQVTGLDLKTGASSTTITLPARAGETRVKIAAGAASVRINLPDGVAGRIRVQSGLAGITIDSARFPNNGSACETPGYESAANRADIFIETGVGSVDVR